MPLLNLKTVDWALWCLQAEYLSQCALNQSFLPSAVFEQMYEIITQARPLANMLPRWIEQNSEQGRILTALQAHSSPQSVRLEIKYSGYEQVVSDSFDRLISSLGNDDLRNVRGSTPLNWWEVVMFIMRHCMNDAAEGLPATSRQGSAFIDRVGFREDFQTDIPRFLYEEGPWKAIVEEWSVDPASAKASIVSGFSKLILRGYDAYQSPMPTELTFQDVPKRAYVYTSDSFRWRDANLFEDTTAGTREVGADQEIASSSQWTGNPTIRDRLFTVRATGRIALQGVDELIHRIEDARINDPEAQVALDELRALRDALNELIAMAEVGRDIAKVGPRFEKVYAIVENHRDGFFKAVGNGAQVGYASCLTIGVVHALATLTSVPITDGLAGTVFAAIYGKDALVSFIKGKAGKDDKKD